MAEDRSKYYKLKLFAPDGSEVSKRLLRIYPEETYGDKWARMQGAMLGQELAINAMHNAKGGICPRCCRSICFICWSMEAAKAKPTGGE